MPLAKPSHYRATSGLSPYRMCAHRAHQIAIPAKVYAFAGIFLNSRLFCTIMDSSISGGFTTKQVIARMHPVSVPLYLERRMIMKKVFIMLLVPAMLLGVMLMPAFAAGESEENLWSGRSAVFVGDSITAGVGTTKTYYQFLEESLGFSSVTTMGISGSCIGSASDYGQSNQPLINRYHTIPSADLIVIFMGTNDYGHETPLGSASDTQDGTFYGALNTIVPALVAAHPSSKIVFVTSLHRYGAGTSKILGTKFTYDHLPNGVGAALGDYVDAVKTVCANNDVSVIDLYAECSLDPSEEQVRTAYMPDGIHPNAAGHELVASIMESHIRDYEPAENEPLDLPTMVQGNKFAAGNNQANRASSRINYFLKAGTVITLKNPDAMQWACARTSNESSSNNLGYFPEKQWTDTVTAVVESDGWIGFTFKYRDEARAFDLRKPLSDYITIHTHSYEAVVTPPTCTQQGYTTYTCLCGDGYMDTYVEAAGHSYINGICTICNFEPSTTLVITEFVNGTYASNSLTSSPKTRLRHDPISVKAGDRCSFSFPDGWSGYICLAYPDQNWDYTPKAWVQEYSYTFQSDMDAFVVMRKDDNSVISPEEYAGEIIFTRKEADPDRDVQLQGYYQKEIDKTIESVKALIGDEPCLVFPMVSDIHYLESAEVPISFDHCIANLKALAKQIDFDFVACLGDITEGNATREITSDRSAHVISGFAQLGIPYYQVIGNHDDNRYGDAVFTHEQLYDNYLRTITGVVFDTSSMYKTNYYKDFDDLAIRCIFLNANTNGDYGYSNETCDWFDEAIKTEKSLIVFTHIPPVPEQNYGARYGTDKGSTRIREACENADNFLIMFSGHNHYDLTITEPFLSFTMNCQKFENKNGDPNLWAKGAVKPQRVAGTETEDCFDIVVVRPESGRIDLIRFGAGKDRFFMIESTHTHSYALAVTAPTCTEQGFTTYTCECGNSYVDNVVAAKGHKWSAATCETAKTCSVCKKTEGTALDHKWTAATCDKAKTCSVCKKTEGSALGHKWTAATCDKAKTCSVCGKTEGSALGHKWSAATCDKAKTCSVCSKTEGIPKDHAWDKGTVTKPATETAEGVMTYKCTTCGKTRIETIPMLSHTHKYEKKVTAPTCTAQGFTTYTCACGHTYQDNFVKATGHKAVTDAAVAPTCTKAGLTAGSHCSVCKAVLQKQETVPAAGHAWDKGTVTKPATEETEGIMTYRCAACGESRTEILPVLPHTHKYTDSVTAPTCTAEGFTTYTCPCGDRYADNTVAALGHDWLDATCQSPKTCKRCGLEEGDPAPHSFGDWRVLHRPTCTSVGQRIRICDCGAEEIESLPMAEHSYKNGKCQACGITNEDYVPGDVTGDGKADYSDALLILRASIGLDTLTDDQKQTADVNADGKADYSDALLILRRSIGLE